MATFRYLRTAAVAVSVLALAAAGTHPAGADDPGGDTAAGYGPDDLVLRVAHTGGLVTAVATVTRLPALSVYGDGRVVTDGPQILIYPGPALPNLQLRRISPAGVQRLVDRALAAGVGTELDTGDHPADGLATRITVSTPAGHRETVVHELDRGISGPGDSEQGEAEQREAEQREAELREAMRALVTDLTDLPATLGPEAVSEEQPYRPSALAAVAQPWAMAAPLEGEGGLGAQPEIAWPGPELPGEALDARLDLHCVTVTGDQLADVLAEAQPANQLTPWTSGGERWLVTLRPLLPDETSCADLPHS